MNVKEVARYLQLQESTIYAWAQQEKIPAEKIGGRWHFRRDDLEAWLERHLHGKNGQEK
jgi:excisionase family DNA binding protein